MKPTLSNTKDRKFYRVGEVWYGVIRQGQGLAFWQRRIGPGRCEGVGLVMRRCVRNWSPIREAVQN
jgi:hypothetical protein